MSRAALAASMTTAVTPWMPKAAARATAIVRESDHLTVQAKRLN
jgi:hypothetical protein